MESSPLTRAHDHARAAAIATQTADTTVAINEHAQAAGEFANASKTTASIEALRTLRLLEQHHKRLSDLLKLPVGPPSQPSTDDFPEQDEKERREQDESKTALPPEESPASKQKSPAKSPPSLPHQRYPGRNLSSSIASNLASARGIRARYSTQPLTPSVSNDQAPGSLEVRPRREASTRSKAPDQLEQARKPSWVPPVIPEDAASESPKSIPVSSTPSDDGFSRFYSTFGSLINRLSAPLAFAGLPLISEEPPASPAHTPPTSEPPQRKSRQKHHLTSAAEPDLTKIYSRAALRALDRDGHGPNDSFYVVPPSGHTASYASILNHESKEKRRMAASFHRPDADDNDNEDDDDFVDARESQVAGMGVPPASPTFRNRLGKSRSEKELRNVIEELHLENASLKEVLDKVSKRLHAFELNSQSSHLALAQSLRLQRPGSPLSSSGGGGGGAKPAATATGPGTGTGEEAALRRRNRELEEQITDMAKRMESLEQDRLKLRVTLEKYRERWEQLKASAKARRENQEQAAEGESRK
ncbi:hypothetical protein N657DRAFT_642296 [Parathielavia appendiculata]|uniref:Uncharacterized protein n=1 Tax=Parathielavia appendiculata TaxID=2587402 RepID=A0AAN6Z591_9PEZI|nr:hypothetical protein N657DRAFT_642296 [Parathielavia appendiculata]